MSKYTWNNRATPKRTVEVHNPDEWWQLEEAGFELWLKHNQFNGLARATWRIKRAHKRKGAGL